MDVSRPTLPDVASRYFAATAARDDDAVLGCFADDAVVVDEGRTMTGPADIRAWREGVATAFEYSTEVVGAEEAADGSLVVTAHLEGDFPGGAVDLRFRFSLRDGAIATLEIAP
jgi:ketosteroid isomerase-like protein